MISDQWRTIVADVMSSSTEPQLGDRNLVVSISLRRDVELWDATQRFTVHRRRGCKRAVMDTARDKCVGRGRSFDARPSLYRTIGVVRAVVRRPDRSVFNAERHEDTYPSIDRTESSVLMHRADVQPSAGDTTLLTFKAFAYPSRRCGSFVPRHGALRRGVAVAGYVRLRQARRASRRSESEQQMVSTSSMPPPKAGLAGLHSETVSPSRVDRTVAS